MNGILSVLSHIMTRILYVGELPIQHSASLEMEILPSQILIVV